MYYTDVGDLKKELVELTSRIKDMECEINNFKVKHECDFDQLYLKRLENKKRDVESEIFYIKSQLDPTVA